MKCPHCKADLTNDFKAVFRLGIIEGENRLQTTINVIKKANNKLFDELLRLDKYEPLNDCCVKISRDYALHLVHILKKKKNYKAARTLKKLIDKQAAAEIIELPGSEKY